MSDFRIHQGPAAPVTGKLTGPRPTQPVTQPAAKSSPEAYQAQARKAVGRQAGAQGLFGLGAAGKAMGDVQQIVADDRLRQNLYQRANQAVGKGVEAIDQISTRLAGPEGQQMHLSPQQAEQVKARLQTELQKILSLGADLQRPGGLKTSSDPQVQQLADQERPMPAVEKLLDQRLAAFDRLLNQASENPGSLLPKQVLQASEHRAEAPSKPGVSAAFDDLRAAISASGNTRDLETLDRIQADFTDAAQDAQSRLADVLDDARDKLPALIGLATMVKNPFTQMNPDDAKQLWESTKLMTSGWGELSGMASMAGWVGKGMEALDQVGNLLNLAGGDRAERFGASLSMGYTAATQIPELFGLTGLNPLSAYSAMGTVYADAVSVARDFAKSHAVQGDAPDLFRLMQRYGVSPGSYQGLAHMMDFGHR